MTREALEAVADDGDLLDLLARELSQRIPPTLRQDTDEFIDHLRTLPVGLRAMAASYDLDVSMTLDDFGYHFANHHHRGLAEETLLALRELGATWEAEIFEVALFHAVQHWTLLGQGDFSSVYYGSALHEALKPLDDQFLNLSRAQCGDSSTILTYWVPYARRHPDRVCG